MMCALGSCVVVLPLHLRKCLYLPRKTFPLGVICITHNVYPLMTHLNTYFAHIFLSSLNICGLIDAKLPYDRNDLLFCKIHQPIKCTPCVLLIVEYTCHLSQLSALSVNLSFKVVYCFAGAITCLNPGGLALIVPGWLASIEALVCTMHIDCPVC